MAINKTRYYEEFLRYAKMSEWQHHNCNLGTTPYADTPFDDDLIKNVFIYDVFERKYAGFNQLLLDIWYDEKDHPYTHKMNDWRRGVVNSFDTTFWDLEEWLFVFFVHRLTGSAINYSQNPSGYYNTCLFSFAQCDDIPQMCEVIRSFKTPKFTSNGYQIAAFPKPKGEYVRGGDYFMCEILPDLCEQFAKWLQQGHKKTFRKMMEWLERYNRSLGCRVFWFQYAATLADIADFFPELLHIDSPFFYGSNAIECLSYMAHKPSGLNQTEFLDSVMKQISKDTNNVAYNAEDVACDCIRWIENYINPKSDYRHLDLDKIWSSHTITDHPFGRQKPMLELGLIKTFNGSGHPSNDKVIRDAKWTIQQYKDEANDEL